MEFLSHFAAAFSDGINGLVASFSQLFQYFISIGVRQEALILILIGGGISFLLILVALFMAMAKVKLKRGTPKAPRENKAAPAERRRGKSTSRFSTLFSPKPQASADDAPQESKSRKAKAESVTGKGFAIFKKRKKPSRLDRKAPAEAPSNAGGQAVDTVLGELAQIERDMLALKELYQSGHIKIDVYVSESRSLYEKAKAIS